MTYVICVGSRVEHWRSVRSGQSCFVGREVARCATGSEAFEPINRNIAVPLPSRVPSYAFLPWYLGWSLLWPLACQCGCRHRFGLE